jgi:hypothetical protein
MITEFALKKDARLFPYHIMWLKYPLDYIMTIMVEFTLKNGAGNI